MTGTFRARSRAVAIYTRKALAPHFFCGYLPACPRLVALAPRSSWLGRARGTSAPIQRIRADPLRSHDEDLALDQLDLRPCGADNFPTIDGAAVARSRDLRNWRTTYDAHWAFRLLGLTRFAFLPLIMAAVLFAWQGFIARVQYFDAVSTSHATTQPIAATIVRFVRHALGLPPPTTFELEQQMSASELLDRWTPLIQSASRRFGVPQSWVRTVMQMESGGRTLSGENRPIVSRAGAMGLMQLMPGTYQEMRAQYGFGASPFDPRNNVYAGAAYLRWLHARYGYPAMFAAYNDGPGHFEARLSHGEKLPQETRNYVTRIAATLGGAIVVGATGGSGAVHGRLVTFTRPNGAAVAIDMNAIVSVRAALPDEYAPGVRTIITVGREQQGVRETLATVAADLHAHGARTHFASNAPQPERRLASLAHKGRFTASYAM